MTKTNCLFIGRQIVSGLILVPYLGIYMYLSSEVEVQWLQDELGVVSRSSAEAEQLSM